MNSQNVFAGAFVDRSGHRREDPDWLIAAIRSEDARFLPVWRNRCLTRGQSPRVNLVRKALAKPYLVEEEAIFLGIFNDEPVFALPIDDEIVAPFDLEKDFHDLRYLGSVLPADESNFNDTRHCTNKLASLTEVLRHLRHRYAKRVWW